ncbi:hypothetical protein [Cryptosporangium japonicum]|uniref:Uncharacterized protein n=1 Tax=Cryptosporangium japonicum TaxID=80872 RepID=A0ABP3E217_9ACTN
MQRIEVTDEGVTVTVVTEPLVSVFGKEMRPASTRVSTVPWAEIDDISLSAIDLEPDGARWVTLMVNTTYGEYLEVPEDAGGFTEVLGHLCRASGVPEPDVAALRAAEIVIWSGREPEPMENR